MVCYIVWMLVCWSVDKNLFNMWQRGEGDFIEYVFIGGYIVLVDN